MVPVPVPRSSTAFSGMTHPSANSRLKKRGGKPARHLP